MGRGAQAQTRQLTDQQLANTNALNQQFTGQQQQRTLGIPAELLNTRANASRGGNGFFSTLASGLGSTLGGLPGALF
jgi:hypothetical protein